MIDLQQAKLLETEAKKNDGHCTHCEQTIKIYRYGISQSMVTALKAMARASRMGGDIIDANKLDLGLNARTQMTKLRYHGLVAKVKRDGHQIPRHWVITTKGWQFLGGGEIPAKAVVYNNQVLGHDGGTTTIKRVGADIDIEQQPISEAESRTYAHIRQPEYSKTVQAEYLGYTSGEMRHGASFELKMSRLQVGKPIMVAAIIAGQQREFEYKDVAAFAKTWKVIE